MWKKVKALLFRGMLSYYRGKAARMGIEVSCTTVVNKTPSLRKCKGSRIILGEHVLLTSNPRHNPLVHRPVCLRTLSPTAIIEMKAYSGISGATIACCNRVTIGEYTMIGPETLIYDSEGHSYSPETGWRSAAIRSGRPIQIGNRCYIGSHCIILGGVTIGDHCVVAAGTVITTDIPAGHKAYGNPAVFEPLPKLLGGPGRRKNTQTA